ncbi:hypothetical protein ECP03052933_5175 [Escherichia coli p0305293.3]|nr:hypothetical protein ECP03052933_5175 [Escherichia coli p0305293.3]
MTVISATTASSPLPDTTGMLTLPAATLHGDGHTTDRHGGFCFIRDTARKLLSLPSGWNATVSVVLCPFTTEAGRRHVIRLPRTVCDLLP